ncbi:TPA: hypothetical protein ACG0AR_002889 [Elizabethkingia anophelis]|uniref:hypothetical protein n=1 Tax=Elizabethkingia anophelis TaxID=1117645 RepID=UPI0020B7AF88|nr:hypothetical protein [Elizabethkingia anophelis]UTG59841.1 hypothetical protein J2O09_10405 [Elizabethkingia anophelis]UXM66028.1 hypothetical protein N7E57_10425 [Elizabethkingia anophelis]
MTSQEVRNKIISILKNNFKIEDSTVSCEYIVTDINIIKELNEKDFIESFLMVDELEIGKKINFDFSLLRLNNIGIYCDIDSFINNNRYEIPNEECYIINQKEFASKNDFYPEYIGTITLQNSLSSISKHEYYDIDEKQLIIFSEEKAILIPILYDIQDFDKSQIPSINALAEALKPSNSADKRTIYINEIIEFLLPIEGQSRFGFLLKNISTLIEKSQSAYNFYLRDFSYNKLKIEIDSKALEFSQKLQSVINDAQTKLIAIPTAFILVLSAFNYNNINDYKNYISVIGLFIFSFLIQMFLNNQKSTLNFIEKNIESYIESFSNNTTIKISEIFTSVEIELTKQKKRLFWTKIILWLLPLMTISLIMFINYYYLLSIIIQIIYLGIMSYLFFTNRY